MSLWVSKIYETKLKYLHALKKNPLLDSISEIHAKEIGIDEPPKEVEESSSSLDLVKQIFIKNFSYKTFF